jgi:hypothetical protein
MNPIQPITNRPLEISVTTPVSSALERVKQVLFRPFDLGRWFIIGFCAWLALLGEQGGGGGIGNYNFGPHHGQDGNGFMREFERVKDYVMTNLYWIVPLAVTLVVLALALGLLFLWLSSRGKFMFLHCVALNKAEVAGPWGQFVREASSLFWFRFVLGLIASAVTLPLVALVVILVVGMVKAGAPSVVGIAASAVALLLIIALAVVFAVIRKLTMDFVVPIMFLRRKKCVEGWRELRGLFAGNVGHFILYFLFQIVLAMIIGTMVLIVVLMTCCIAGCLMALPYLGTVLLLPVLVFQRAYSLYYLAQFGPQFDVFPPAPTPAPAPGDIPPFPGSSARVA